MIPAPQPDTWSATLAGGRWDFRLCPACGGSGFSRSHKRCWCSACSGRGYWRKLGHAYNWTQQRSE